jgi:hypothetical protein
MDARIPMNVVNKSIDLRSSPRHKIMGKGANSFVYQDKEDTEKLNTVTRIGSAEDYDDMGYKTYIEFLQARPKLRSNPYLPRIHGVTGKDGVIQYDVERLHPFDTEKIASVEVLLAVAERAFVDSTVRRMRHEAENNTEYDAIEDLRSDIVHNIRGLIGRGNGSNIDRMVMLKENVKDPMLIQAIQVITYLLKYNQQRVNDVHQGNVMWRITGTMPQLVITDPLY